eukprot:scaffold35153_cov48-Attheya_sp.AAC.4
MLIVLPTRCTVQRTRRNCSRQGRLTDFAHELYPTTNTSASARALFCLRTMALEGQGSFKILLSAKFPCNDASLAVWSSRLLKGGPSCSYCNELGYQESRRERGEGLF